jgi:hypothetical protein
MTWSVPLPLRPGAALLSRRRSAAAAWLRTVRAVDAGPGPSPITVRRHSGWLLIEVRQEIGPAAEPHLGRLLHGAIRPGSAGVLVDLRHTAELGAGGIDVVRLARTLADRHGLAFGCIGGSPTASALPLSGRQLPDRLTAVSGPGP